MIKLVSIHIPKTAGSSFSQILRRAYGKEGLLRAYGMRGTPETIDMSLFPDVNKRKIRVVHGHVRYSQVHKITRKNRAKLITWVRDPVKRVISNYYYSMYRIREGIARPEREAIRDYSLLEYANMEENKNMMSWFLEGTRPDDFFFIGFTENFEEDVEILGEKLKWPRSLKANPHKKDGSAFIQNNDCKTQFNDISDAMREEIASLNQLDISLYEEVKRIRAGK